MATSGVAVLFRRIGGCHPFPPPGFYLCVTNLAAARPATHRWFDRLTQALAYRHENWMMARRIPAKYRVLVVAGTLTGTLRAAAGAGRHLRYDRESAVCALYIHCQTVIFTFVAKEKAPVGAFSIFCFFT